MLDIITKLGLNSFDIRFEESNNEFDLEVLKNNNSVIIRTTKQVLKFRGLGILKTRQNETSFEVHEKSQFENLGYLIDVARDAVPTVKTFSDMALKLALLGYTRIFINFEDLITLDDEPLFGHLRGRYSKEELKQMDKTCLDLGIELIPCVQTLAHLNGMFFWPSFDYMKDTNDILLPGSEHTYAFIEKVFKTIRECFTTKTVHIGMDEAGMVGRGKYLDLNGYHKPSEVMLSHLNKVVEFTKKYDLKPQMWSDMFFRLAFGGYYTKDGTLSQEVVSLVPEGVEQVYWDYVTDDNAMLNNMFKNHKLFKGTTSFASGGWKWNGWSPSNKFSIYLAKYQLKACKKHGIKNIMLTAWSDDGAEASIYSILPTIIYYAEYIYSNNLKTSNLETISLSLFEVSYKAMLDSDLTLVEPDEVLENYNYLNYSMLPKIMIYNDPLSGPYTGILKRFSFKNLPILKRKMHKYAAKYPAFKGYFKNLENLCSCLLLKNEIMAKIEVGYKSSDINLLTDICKKLIPNFIKNLDTFIKTFYTQWMSENKTNSFEVHAIRLGGLKERFNIVKNLLEEYISGKRERIEELEIEEVKIKDFDALLMLLWTVYRKINTVNVF